jgi:tetratricopeptide (TPR) repeat protein
MKRTNQRIVAVLLFLLALPMMAARAAGATDNSDPVEKARATFHQGVQLYNEGSFDAALAEFRKAYRLSPNYRLLYNIALTYFDLHDYVSSIKYLKQYVKEGGSDISTERRRQVGELNQKLEERIASLEIGCNLEGADIQVDDISVGVSPIAFPVLVNAGPRRVTAVKLGHAVVARMVTVGGKENAKVFLEFAVPVEAQGGERAKSRGAGDTDGALSTAFKSEPAQKAPVRIGLVTSGLVAGSCAIATGVFGVMALNAKNDFGNALNQIPNTKDNIDSARSKVRTYARLTDAFGAATLISGSVALYYLLSDPGPKKTSGKTSSIALAPTVGGLLLHGEW